MYYGMPDMLQMEDVDQLWQFMASWLCQLLQQEA